MRIRPLQRDDRDALLRIWNDSATYDRLGAALLEEKIWADQDLVPACCLVADTDGRTAGFAVGVVRESGTGYVKLLAVDRELQRQGIGRALLEALESSLAASGATAIRLLEAAPNYLVPGIDVRYEAAIRFAEACHYERTGVATNLRVDLDDALQRLRDAATAPGLEVRRAAPGDEESVRRFLAANWPGWTAEALSALGNTPSTLHIAVRDGSVVGFSASDANNKGTGWFGPMGVAPDVRQSGIGRVLLGRCLSDLHRQGHRHATIPWVDPVAFYERCAGAWPARSFLRFEKRVARQVT